MKILSLSKELFKKLMEAVELGKVDKKSPYPPQLQGQDGAFEIAKITLGQGCKPGEILENALIPAMANVGNRFSRRKIYVPQMLMSASYCRPLGIAYNNYGEYEKLKGRIN